MTDNAEILNAKIDLLHTRMHSIEATMAKVADAMERIARIEERMQANSQAMERAFNGIEKVSKALSAHMEESDKRIKLLETSQPVQRLVSEWVIRLVVGVMTLVLGIVAAKTLGA